MDEQNHPAPEPAASQPALASPAYYDEQGNRVIFVPPSRTNGFAIASMVLGIVWVYWIGSILALVFGYKARREIARSGGTQSGGGMATAGIVLGWIGVGTLTLIFVFFLIGLIAGDANF